MQVGSTPNTIVFGSTTSSGIQSKSINFVGGQQVIVRGQGSSVNSIQIGNDILCGGTGGNAQAPTGGTEILPADGTFNLLAMEGVNGGAIHYLKFEMSGMIVEAGSTANGNGVLTFPSGLPVQFSKIYYTTGGSGTIFGIEFLLVSSS